MICFDFIGGRSFFKSCQGKQRQIDGDFIQDIELKRLSKTIKNVSLSEMGQSFER